MRDNPWGMQSALPLPSPKYFLLSSCTSPIWFSILECSKVCEGSKTQVLVRVSFCCKQQKPPNKEGLNEIDTSFSLKFQKSRVNTIQYGTHKPRVATEHLKYGQPLSRCVVSRKDIDSPIFTDLLSAFPGPCSQPWPGRQGDDHPSDTSSEGQERPTATSLR